MGVDLGVWEPDWCFHDEGYQSQLLKALCNQICNNEDIKQSQGSRIFVCGVWEKRTVTNDRTNHRAGIATLLYMLCCGHLWWIVIPKWIFMPLGQFAHTFWGKPPTRLGISC